MSIYAAVEGGGTSWVVALVSDRPDNIVERMSVVTETPEITLGKIREWLNTKKFDALGVASFGPVDCKISSPTYGFITSTPKPNWANTDVLRLLGVYDEFASIPCLFDTDVNAPALAEFNLHKQSANMSSAAYITVGTGIGVGLVVNGSTVKGLVHPEGGHLLVQTKPGDTFAGCCPYHGRCVEGLVASGALCARKGCSIHDLPTFGDDDELWDTVAYYLAQLCCNLILTVSPEHISIGGGVMNRKCLYPKIRTFTLALLNDYIKHTLLTPANIEQLIGPSFWESQAGIVGAAYLAQLALENKK